MAKKKPAPPNKKKQVNADNVIGLHSEVTAQPITETLETNYMPYAMSTNVSRARSRDRRLQPSHRKLLYTMYKMGLLKGERQKSANIVGQTMKLNSARRRRHLRDDGPPRHGQRGTARAVRGVQGQLWQVLLGRPDLTPPRGTPRPSFPICAEIFKDIDKDPVDFVWTATTAP